MQGSAHFSTFPGKTDLTGGCHPDFCCPFWQCWFTTGQLQHAPFLQNHGPARSSAETPVIRSIWRLGSTMMGRGGQTLPHSWARSLFPVAMWWCYDMVFLEHLFVDEDLWQSLLDRFRQCKTHFKTMSYLLRIMWSTISKPFQAYFALFNLKKTSLVQNHKNSSVRTWLAGKSANL